MMGDGHLNKCKECTKKDVKDRYDKKMLDIEFVEKERKRGREKYARLNYKNKVVNPDLRVSKNVNRNLRARGFDMTMKEAHHWNYNLEKSIFILGRREHKLVHKKLSYDKETKMFKCNGVLLDTKEKHRKYIESVFKDNDLNIDIRDVEF